MCVWIPVNTTVHATVRRCRWCVINAVFHSVLCNWCMHYNKLECNIINFICVGRLVQLEVLKLCEELCGLM